jgi:hypothetical protein
MVRACFKTENSKPPMCGVHFRASILIDTLRTYTRVSAFVSTRDRLILMSLTDLVSSIDSEISLLQEARALLAGQNGNTPRTIKPAKKKRHTMSAAARKRIGDAQRKRWAAQRKATKTAA